MRLDQTERIVLDSALRDLPGTFDLNRAGERIALDGKTYNYLSTGHQRVVYRSECGKWVVKAPRNTGWDDHSATLLAEYKQGDLKERFLPYTFLHNWHEAQAYAECPEEYRDFLAVTEYLPEFGWVKQEYVEVYRTFADSDMIESGVTGAGKVVMFDMDALMQEHGEMNVRPAHGYLYSRLPRLISLSQAKLTEMGVDFKKFNL